MSEKNVEVYRALFKAWNAGDMEAVGDLYDADAVLRGPEGWPERGPFVGREAVMRQWEQQRDPWDEDVLEPMDDFIDAGDRVVVRLLWRGGGHGPDLSMEMTGVMTLRRGKIVHHEFFWNHVEALEAAGLSETEK